MLTVSVLGPVELRRDGERLPLRPGKTTEVLVRLALEAGTLVRTERLIEDLWADAAPATGRNTLQTKVSALRRALGGAAVVTGTSAGYTLEIDADAVDALAVPRLAAAAHGALDAGDAATAAATCENALALFRGEILCDAGDGDWLTPHRVSLEDTRLRLLEDLYSARLRTGAIGGVTGNLEALVVAHPLREGLWALLITALYQEGRQADALAAYTRVRELLGEELGLDPGPELRELEQRVLLQDPALDSVPRAEPGNLPPLSSALVGRHSECETLVQLLHDERLVTVVGPAGVGKTRVAIEVARAVERFAGSWLVRLDVARSATVIETIAAAFGIAGGTAPMLLDRLRGADALVVLDNCEHVLDAVTDLVPELLAVAPALRVLATSQLPLGVDGETTVALEPLALEDAMELFARRAKVQRPSFVMDAETAATTSEVCRALDGLPLAIELAAARTKTLSVDEIARRLDDRFAVLSDPTGRRSARHRTLAAAITWSYDLLFPDDQRGLWVLACFTDGASLAAVEHVLATLDVPRGAAIDVIGRLADRSLVTVDGNFRYRLLDSVRAFGLERLQESGAADDVRAAYAEWFGAAADAAAAESRGPEQVRHLAMVRTERANIDAALAWATVHDAPLALRIARGFGWAWVVIGDGALAAGRLRAALAAAGDDALAWSLVPWLEAGNNIDNAFTAAMRAVELARGATEHAMSRLALAFVLIQQGRTEEAIALLEACRSEFHDLGLAWEEGACCVLTAHAAVVDGNAAVAADACADAEPIVRALGDDWAIDHMDAIQGQVARVEGRLEDAAAYLTDAAEVAARLGFATTEGYHLVNLGQVLLEAGDDDAAVTALERAKEIGRATAEMQVVERAHELLVAATGRAVPPTG